MSPVFYLGTHQPAWLEVVNFRLFISHRRLLGGDRPRKSLPRAASPWALDSGGFSELSMFGEWRTTPGEYVAAVRRYDDEIGRMEWAAPMDWMCEPHMLSLTGLTIKEHQQRTVDNFIQLTEMWEEPEPPFMPVLQGWELADYHRCVEMYANAGVNLDDWPVVGIGSVCRRQATPAIGRLIRSLASYDYPLHGFGVKTLGLRRYGSYLNSADSLAWSSRGRRVAGCTPTHQSEANCLPFATAWRQAALRAIEAPDDFDQMELQFEDVMV